MAMAIRQVTQTWGLVGPGHFNCPRTHIAKPKKWLAMAKHDECLSKWRVFTIAWYEFFLSLITSFEELLN